jgi:hypothetical protein
MPFADPHATTGYLSRKTHSPAASRPPPIRRRTDQTTEIQNKNG